MNNIDLMNYWIKSADNDYKNSFYKKCTSEYTSEQIKNIKEIRKWLKELLIEK